MRLLIIAPFSDLETHSEVMDAVGPSNTEILHGSISVKQVLEVIATGEFEALHFAGHGERQSLTFTDGNLDSALLADAIRRHGNVTLCLLNSCQSVGVALACYSAGSVYAIGWQDDVGDSVANTFAFAFWSSYKMNGNIVDAYKTGRESVIWGHAGSQTPALLNGRTREAMNTIESLTREISKARYVTVGLFGITTFLLLLLIFQHYF
jgi:hypothetical protein